MYIISVDAVITVACDLLVRCTKVNLFSAWDHISTGRSEINISRLLQVAKTELSDTASGVNWYV